MNARAPDLDPDTIVALSTPPGVAALALVRLSGAAARAVAARVLRAPSGGAPRLAHRRIEPVDVVSPDGERIDRAMVAALHAPHSYTGEDTVEITIHGGVAVVRDTIAALREAGARPAEPGEFTRRAFLNGRIDLVQAEAVADLIAARGHVQRRAASAVLSGGLSAQIDAAARPLVEFLALVEAHIDFVDEDIGELDLAEARDRLEDVRRRLDELLAAGRFARPLREGFQVVVAGPVNAGKSTLFNALVGGERAIVTDTPGTTRDVLRESVVLDGQVFVFHDTAGLRHQAPDDVERIGIERAGAAMREADAVVWVIDGGAPEPALPPRALVAGPAACIVVWNKTDLRPAPPRLIVAGEVDVAPVPVCARTGEGVPELREAIVAQAGAPELSRAVAERFVVTERVAGEIGAARRALDRLDAALGAGSPLETLAVEVREVLAPLESALGRRFDTDLLDALFRRFCIGK